MKNVHLTGVYAAVEAVYRLLWPDLVTIHLSNVTDSFRLVTFQFLVQSKAL